MSSIIRICRHLVWLPVVGSLILAAALGAFGIAHILSAAKRIIANGDYSIKAVKMVTIAAIESIDLFS